MTEVYLKKKSREVIRPKKMFDPSFHSYSHGIIAGDMIFVAGQMAFVNDKRRGRKLVGRGNIVLQTRQVFKNIAGVLSVEGASLKDIAMLNVYLKDIRDLDKFCKVRREFFKHDPPASTSVQVSGFASPEGLVEVNAIAVVPSGKVYSTPRKWHREDEP